MSLLDPLSCGFLKVAVYEIITTHSKRVIQSKREKSEDYDEMYHSMKELFISFDFDGFGKDKFVKICGKLKQLFANLFKDGLEKKMKVMMTFGSHNWVKLDQKERESHRLFDCNQCLKKYRIPLSYFPINKANRAFKKRAVEAGLFEVVDGSESEEEVVNKNIQENILRQAKKDIEKQWAQRHQ